MAAINQRNYVHQRKHLADVTLHTVGTAMGREPADLIIRNGRLVNVNIGRIQDGVDWSCGMGSSFWWVIRRMLRQMLIPKSWMLMGVISCRASLTRTSMWRAA